MDNKTYRAIIREDHRHMVRMTKMLSFIEFGFTTFPHKKGFHVKKVPSKYCLREFDFVFPTLDAAIFYMEGYTQARHVTGEGEDGPDSSGGGQKIPQPIVH